MRRVNACRPRSDKIARFSDVTVVGISTEEEADSCVVVPAPAAAGEHDDPPRVNTPNGTRWLLVVPVNSFVPDCTNPVRPLDRDVANEDDEDALTSIQKTVEHWNFMIQNCRSINRRGNDSSKLREKDTVGPIAMVCTMTRDLGADRKIGNDTQYLHMKYQVGFWP